MREIGAVCAQVPTAVEASHKKISTDEFGCTSKLQCTMTADGIICTNLIDDTDVMSMFDTIQRNDLDINPFPLQLFLTLHVKK